MWFNLLLCLYLIFTLIYYTQNKYTSNQSNLVLWIVFSLQFITLGTYNINGSIWSNSFFRALGYVDGTAWGFLAGNNISFIAFGVAAILLIYFIFHGMTCIFYEHIQLTNKKILIFNRMIFDLIRTILYVIFLNIAISTFDCYILSSQSILRCGTV